MRRWFVWIVAAGMATMGVGTSSSPSLAAAAQGLGLPLTVHLVTGCLTREQRAMVIDQIDRIWRSYGISHLEGRIRIRGSRDKGRSSISALRRRSPGTAKH